MPHFNLKLKAVLIATAFCAFSLTGLSQSHTSSVFTGSDNYFDGNVITDPAFFRLKNRGFVGFDLSVIPSINAEKEFVGRSHVMFRLGYRTSHNVMTGCIGVEFMEEKMFMPITFEYKRYLSTEKWAPYLYAGAGYAWHLKGNIVSHFSTSNYPEYPGGLTASAGVGYSVATIMNEFYFALGYSYRKLTEQKYIAANEKTERNLSMNGISLTVGLTF